MGGQAARRRASAAVSVRSFTLNPPWNSHTHAARKPPYLHRSLCRRAKLYGILQQRIQGDPSLLGAMLCDQPGLAAAILGNDLAVFERLLTVLLSTRAVRRSEGAGFFSCLRHASANETPSAGKWRGNRRGLLQRTAVLKALRPPLAVQQPTTALAPGRAKPTHLRRHRFRNWFGYGSQPVSV